MEKEFYPRFLAQTETIFSLANGYLGMRGCFEEGTRVFENAKFINAFYEIWPICYGEEAHGFAKEGQTNCQGDRYQDYQTGHFETRLHR